MVTEATYIDKLEQQFQTLAPSLPGAGQDWLAEQRRHDMAEFQALGIPSQRVEAWKYTSLNNLKKADYLPAPVNSQALSSPLPHAAIANAPRLVFVNGSYRADLSNIAGLPKGVSLEATAELLAASDSEIRELLKPGADSLPFAALNSAFMDTGFVVRIAAGENITSPLEVISISDQADNTAVHGRNLILLEKDSTLNLIERQVALNDGDYFANNVTHVRLAENAKLTHFRHQDEAISATQIATLFADLEAGSHYDNFTLSTGSRLSRNEIHISLNGPGAHTRLNGAYMVGGKQHCDTTTVINHRAADTSSSETYKGVLAGSAQGVFAGRITVEPGAQRITGNQLSRALLLSDKAQINAKPELEIFADDVQYSHGATAGELAEDALFYLKSRGIPETEARQLLISAFVAEIINSIEIPAAKDLADGAVAAWQQHASDGESA